MSATSAPEARRKASAMKSAMFVSSVRLVALRASSGTLVRPTGVESSAVNFAYFSTTGAKAASSSTEASTGMICQSMDSTLPVDGVDVEVDAPKLARVGRHLEDGDAARGRLQERVLVPADDDVYPRRAARERLVLREREMRERHDGLRAGRAHLRDDGAGGLAGVAELGRRGRASRSSSSRAARARGCRPSRRRSRASSKAGVSPKIFPVFESTTFAPSHLNFDSFIRCSSTSSP